MSVHRRLQRVATASLALAASSCHDSPADDPPSVTAPATAAPGVAPPSVAPPSAAPTIAPVAAAASWQALPALGTPRHDHTTTVLRDGTIVAIGGIGSDGRTLASIEVLAPGAAAWRVAGHLAHARAYATATVMPDGRLLVAGGRADLTTITPLATTELVDVTTGAVTAGPPLVHARWQHAAVVTATGDLWLVGGSDGIAASLAPDLLPAGATQFRAAPAAAHETCCDAAWPARDGIVVVTAGRREWRTAIPKYGRWLHHGVRTLPPLVSAISPARTRSVAHALPAAETAAATATRDGALLLGRRAAQLLAWTYDAAGDAFAEIEPPPLDSSPLLVTAGDTVVAYDETHAYRRDAAGAAWTPLSPPPAGLFQFTLAAGSDALVLVGGMDRERADRGASSRAFRLALPGGAP